MHWTIQEPVRHRRRVGRALLAKIAVAAVLVLPCARARAADLWEVLVTATDGSGTPGVTPEFGFGFRKDNGLNFSVGYRSDIADGDDTYEVRGYKGQCQQ